MTNHIKIWHLDFDLDDEQQLPAAATFVHALIGVMNANPENYSHLGKEALRFIAQLDLNQPAHLTAFETVVIEPIGKYSRAAPILVHSGYAAEVMAFAKNLDLESTNHLQALVHILGSATVRALSINGQGTGVIDILETLDWNNPAQFDSVKALLKPDCTALVNPINTAARTNDTDVLHRALVILERLDAADPEQVACLEENLSPVLGIYRDNVSDPQLFERAETLFRKYTPEPPPGYYNLGPCLERENTVLAM